MERARGRKNLPISIERFKACAHGKRRGAFYDASRNRSGKWCSMRRCGTMLSLE